MSIDAKSTYYDTGGIETIAIIKAKLTDEQFRGFCLGNAIKYLCRYNSKHNFEKDKTRDAEKAVVYLSELAELNKEENKT